MGRHDEGTDTIGRGLGHSKVDGDHGECPEIQNSVQAVCEITIDKAEVPLPQLMGICLKQIDESLKSGRHADTGRRTER